MKSCYDECVKTFFNYRRTYTVTHVFTELGLPTFDTLMHNSRISFKNVCRSCANNLVARMYRIGRCLSVVLVFLCVLVFFLLNDLLICNSLLGTPVSVRLVLIVRRLFSCAPCCPKQT